MKLKEIQDIKRLQSATERSVGRLIELTKEKDFKVAVAAVETIENTRPVSVTAVKALVALAQRDGGKAMLASVSKRALLAVAHLSDAHDDDATREASVLAARRILADATGSIFLDYETVDTAAHALRHLKQADVLLDVIRTTRDPRLATICTMNLAMTPLAALARDSSANDVLVETLDKWKDQDQICLELLRVFVSLNIAREKSFRPASCKSLIEIAVEHKPYGERLRCLAAEYLGSFEQSVLKPHFPVIADASQDRIDAARRHAGIIALTAFGSASADAYTAFENAYNNEKGHDLRRELLTLGGRFGPLAKPLTGDLVQELERAPDPQTKMVILGNLAQIGSDASAAIPAVQKILESSSGPSLRNACVVCLGEIGANQPAARVLLANILSDSSSDEATRGAAALGLGKIGVTACPSLPELATALEREQHAVVRKSIRETMLSIAFSMSLTNDQSSLESAITILKQSSSTNPDIQTALEGLAARQNLLRTAAQKLEREALASMLQRQFVIIGFVGTIAFLLIMWGLFWWLSPLTLYRIAGFLRRCGSVTVPKMSVKVSLATITLCDLFALSRRVCDAWVRDRAPGAFYLFEADTRLKRTMDSFVSLQCDSKLPSQSTSGDDIMRLQEQAPMIALCGPGGAGKSTLAQHYVHARLRCAAHQLTDCGVLAIPLWLDQGATADIRTKSRKNARPLTSKGIAVEQSNDNSESAAVSTAGDVVGLEGIARSRLQAITRSPRIEDAIFFDCLLRNRRVVLVADGISEWTEESQIAFVSFAQEHGSPNFVATCRHDSAIAVLQPFAVNVLPLCGAQLVAFMNSYTQCLVHLDSKKTQTSEVISLSGEMESEANSDTGQSAMNGDAQQRHPPTKDIDSSELRVQLNLSIVCEYQTLDRLAGGRPIATIWVADYCDQMFASYKAGLRFEAPTTFIAFVRGHLRFLRSRIDPALRERFSLAEVQEAAEKIAWLCIKKKWVPTSADREQIRAIVGGDSDKIVDHLEDALAVVQSEGPQRNSIRFVLDPLAERLAAFYAAKLKHDRPNEYLLASSQVSSEEDRSASERFAELVKEVVSETRNH